MRDQCNVWSLCLSHGVAILCLVPACLQAHACEQLGMSCCVERAVVQTVDLLIVSGISAAM